MKILRFLIIIIFYNNCDRNQKRTERKDKLQHLSKQNDLASKICSQNRTKHVLN